MHTIYCNVLSGQALLARLQPVLGIFHGQQHDKFPLALLHKLLYHSTQLVYEHVAVLLDHNLRLRAITPPRSVRSQKS